MGIEQWSPTAADNVLAKTGINWDEGQAPSSVNDSARSTMADIKEWHIDAEWLKLGENGSANAYSISFVSTTVFKFTGTDRRSLATVGRRIKAGVGAGVIYGHITESSLSASDTQVTVSFDSGQLDSSLSFVSVGIINPANSSMPVLRDSYPHFEDASTPTKKARVECSSISAGATIVLTVPNRNVTLGGTLVASVSASGAAVDFTGIPAGTRRIKIMLNEVSLNGNTELIFQIGDTDGIEDAGYAGASNQTSAGNATAGANPTGSWRTTSASSSASFNGTVTIDLMDASTFKWTCHGHLYRSDSAAVDNFGGSKALSAELDRVRIASSDGTSTFDTGNIAISYE